MVISEGKTMTAEQIEMAVDNYRVLLTEHSGEFDTRAVEVALATSELADEQFAIFSRYVEVFSDLIVCKVRVDRSRSPQEAINATGCVQYTDREVVDSMPKGEGDEVEVVLFKPDLSERNGFISDDDLEKELELCGLKPADPISAAAVNEAYPAFADKMPHGTHWKDAKGSWCCATFRRWARQAQGGRRPLRPRLERRLVDPQCSQVVLNTKSLWTPVLRNLVLSPVPLYLLSAEIAEWGFVMSNE